MRWFWIPRQAIENARASFSIGLSKAKTLFGQFLKSKLGMYLRWKRAPVQLGMMVGIIAVGLWFRCQPLIDIVRHENVTTGQVIATRCGERVDIRYQFDAPTPFLREGSLGEQCLDARARGTVKVYFSALHPEHSTLSEPREALKVELIGIFVVALIVPPLAMVRYWHWR
jgi:hypothetical protein